jgi:hypothetical protein
VENCRDLIYALSSHNFMQIDDKSHRCDNDRRVIARQHAIFSDDKSAELFVSV